ncbi:MAG TPA: sigma 54-interacting transcriptional regulator [Candidatus Sulfotelmatobacter sp.]|nr:sigma 54-interacting transcriptional regulator [Candidatus Sulfotelmatobacter sp.]
MRFDDQKPGNPLPGAKAFADPEKLLEAYFSSESAGLCIFDTEFRYLAINDALARMNCLPAKEHIGKTVREVLGDYAAALEKDLQRVIDTGETVLNSEASGELRSRKDVGHFVGHLVPIKDEAGRVTRIGVMVVEVTAQRKLEQSLEQVDTKLKREMDRRQVLLDITGILSSSWDLKKVFPAVSARIRRLLQHEYAGFSLKDSTTGLLVRQVEDFPLSRGLASTAQISASNSPGGRSLDLGIPLIFSKEELESFDAEISRALLGEGLRSLCCVPLMRPHGPLGVFVLGSTRQKAFQAEDLGLLNQVGALLAIALENRKAADEIDALKLRLAEERKHLGDEVRSQGEFTEIIGESKSLQNVLEQVSVVAASDATVLILGETGTGKELIARAIHRLSTRSGAAFIKMNCAAIPTGLLESELFGHERGAFTGAISRKIGRLELAHGGTLFLDEVGEIPIELQPKLLRVLQDHEFERLGSNRTIHVNVRLVAATNRDLASSVAKREFRNDLFYRLNVFPIRIPALRERREDIPHLVRYFVRKFSQRLNRNIEGISKETMAALEAWNWPGNVRELENLMERSVILSTGQTLHVPLADLGGHREMHGSERDQSLDRAEREHIIRVLRETRGVIGGPQGAARRLGLKRTTLQSKMQRLGITRKDYPQKP